MENTPSLVCIAELKQQAGGSPQAFAFHAQVTDVQLRTTKQGKEYLDLSFGDGSDAFSLKVWSDAPVFSTARSLQPATFLEISGEWTSGAYGIESRQWHYRTLSPTEKATLLAGTPALRERQEADFAAIQSLVGGMADPRLRGLCQLFLDEFGERFRRTAAAREYHHARRGGLVEHVAQMMRSAAALCTVYQSANRDLLLAGVLFHDCGKLWENCYPADGFAMPHYETGEMLGHIMLGVELVNKLWRRVLDAPGAESWLTLEPTTESVRLHLLHLIASHHGEYQFGSPVLPKTPEAILLHHVDNIDAKWEMFQETYAKSAKLGKNIFERRRPLLTNAIQPLASVEPAEDNPPTGSA